MNSTKNIPRVNRQRDREVDGMVRCILVYESILRQIALKWKCLTEPWDRESLQMANLGTA